MADSINWLHLSDLHFGLDDRSWLWPKLKHDLFRDIEKLADQVGGWDIVFFTGDFTQTGSAAEFDRLNKELEDLWKVLAQSGRTPGICIVPGNHDLVRPEGGSAITRTLTQLWWNQPDLRRQFWREESCEYREAVRQFFVNFSAWAANLPVPALPTVPGILPGDFSATFTKGGVELGILGLNSTFLQIASGNWKEKLDLHVSQLNAVCGGDPVLWLKERTTSVLLTHQPPSWLAPEAADHFRQEIYPAGRFFAQLCGHQHEPEAFELSEAGALPRRLRQAPSVFGLENWDGTDPKQRIHGYTAGQFTFEASGGFEKLWPRVAVKARHGGLNIGPDLTFTLQDGDCMVTPFDLDREDSGPPPANPVAVLRSDAEEEDKKSAAPKIEWQLLDEPPDEQTAKATLAPCPRLNLSFGPQHRYVRQDEQSQLESELRKKRCVWLIADWGIGREGFLASALDRFRGQDKSPEVFHLRCDDASDIDSLEALFSQQFGMALQAFCSFVERLKNSFLVLDGIHPSLCSGDNLSRLKRIASAVIDYCPDLRLILISRLRPDAEVFSLVDLRPLDVPDVRTYLMHHPDATADLHEPDVIEKLHEHSDGLPMHLDRMLKALKVSSLASLLEADMEGPLAVDGMPEATPIALAHAVSSLARSEDKRSRRSFALLKVLSVLPYGETLEALQHYLPTEPFFYENALQLNESALLDVIPLQQTNPQAGEGRPGSSDQAVPKILKVPRQVRDYVQTLLSEAEREKIVSAGIERFFGRARREGKVKLRSVPPEYHEYVASGAGNEFALVHHLIAQGRGKSDKAAVRRGARLGIHYARFLELGERYRDLAQVAGALVQVIDRDERPDDWSQVAILYGKGLRMIGKHREALKYLKGALEVGSANLQADAVASIWLNIALTEEMLGNTEEAVAAAEEVKRHTKLNSGVYLHALSILVGLTQTGAEKAQEWSKLEKQARAGGFLSLAGTIALDLAEEAETPESEIRQLDKVITTKGGAYNQIRAVIAKAEAVERLEKPGELKTSEILSLSAAYSYLYAQRLGALFDRCHEALWQVLESKGETPKLLRLFRHTSFVWRIRGDETKEANYLKRLSERHVQDTELAPVKGFVVEIRYFMRRLKLVITDAAAPAKPEKEE